MTCAAPWHAGMAHTLGFMRAAIMAIEGGSLAGAPKGEDSN